MFGVFGILFLLFGFVGGILALSGITENGWDKGKRALFVSIVVLFLGIGFIVYDKTSPTETHEVKKWVTNDFGSYHFSEPVIIRKYEKLSIRKGTNFNDSTFYEIEIIEED